MAQPRFRILALDIDGTLLDRAGKLRPRTVEAINMARDAGIRPILCTGRRYRRASPIAELLNIDDPLVCNSGAIVKDPRTHQTLWRADLSPEVVATILDIFRRRDEPVVSFTDSTPDQLDFMIRADRSGRPLFDDYLDRNEGHAETVPEWSKLLSSTHYHLCAIGTHEDMLDFDREVLDHLANEVRTFVQKSPRYAGTMCEILRRDASKWRALLEIADQWQIDPSEICAVGDDMNDLPMIEGAGLGVAMGHANDAVRAVAGHVTGTDEEEGLATFIEAHLLS